MSNKTLLSVDSKEYNETIEALGQERGYREKVRNPDFDQGKEQSEDNQFKIKNPQSKEKFAKEYLYSYVKKIINKHKTEN